MTWKNDQVSEGETRKILELARECMDVPGDFAEFGCYKGDTSLVLAEVLQNLDKRLWLYDSFEGLPEKSAEDESALGQDFKAGELFVTKRAVKERFLRAGLSVPVIKKAWFSELASEDLPGEIAFCFVDGDFYESTRDVLRLIKPKMDPNGVILVHDYANPALPGVAKAVDEWVKGKNYKIEVFQSMAILRGKHER